MRLYTPQGKISLQQTPYPGFLAVCQRNQEEIETDMFIRSIIGNISVSVKWLEEIRHKQSTNKIYSQVINFYKIKHWPEAATQNAELRPNRFVSEYLTVYRGLSLYQSRFIIPADRQKEILDRLHEGYQAMVKCRALVQDNVW